MLREGYLRRQHELCHGGQHAVLWDTCVTIDQQNEVPYAHIAAGQECLLWGLRQRPQAYLLQCLILIQALLLQ